MKSAAVSQSLRAMSSRELSASIRTLDNQEDATSTTQDLHNSFSSIILDQSDDILDVTRGASRYRPNPVERSGSSPKEAIAPVTPIMCCGKVSEDGEDKIESVHKKDDAASSSSTTISNNLGDPINDSNTTCGNMRNCLGAFVNNRWVQLVVTCLIVLNAVILGAMTCLDEESKWYFALETVDASILYMFTIETGLQFVYLGPSKFIKNGWLLFDAIIVGTSWAFMDSQMAIFRSFRIFRLFALVSRCSSLRRLFKAVAKTIPNMATIAAALLLIFYTFCVFFTGLYQDLWEQGVLDEDYFGRLDYTFLTLFQIMTLDSWTSVVRQVMDVYPYSWLGFVVWVILTSFFILNLVVAVICESLIELHTTAAAVDDARNQTELLDEQKDLMETQTQELVDECRQILAIQKHMLSHQRKLEDELVEIMKEVKELRAAHASWETGHLVTAHKQEFLSEETNPQRPAQNTSGPGGDV